MRHRIPIGFAPPNWVARLAAKRNPAMRALLPERGKQKNLSSGKTRQRVDWTPRVVATAENLIALDLITD